MLPGGVFGFIFRDEVLQVEDGELYQALVGGGDEGAALLGDGGVRVVDGLSLADFVVGGFGGTLSGGEHLLVQLLAGAQTGVLNLDVLIGLEAGQANHAAGEVSNLDRLAHVEHENLAAVAHGAGLKDESAGLGDGHEEADDVRVGDGDGAALFNLLAESGYHGAIAAQNVAESGGDVAGVRGIGSIGGQLRIQALHVHLGRALGGTHYVGGVHGLVGGNHHELLHPVLAGNLGHVDGALYVGDDGLAGVLLHERNVLVGSGMEDDGGLVLGHDIGAAGAVADIGHHGGEGHLQVLLLNLESDEVHGGLGTVEQYHAGGGELAALAHNLAADAAGGTGHEDDAAGDFGADALLLDDDFGALEQVLNLNGGDVEGGIGRHAVDVGDDVEGYAGAGAPVGYAVALALQGGIGHEDDGVGHVGGDVLLQSVEVVAAVHAQFADGELGGVGIRVDDGGGEVGAAVGLLNIGGEGCGFLDVAVNEDFLGMVVAALCCTQDGIVGTDHGDAQADDEGAGDEEVADGEDDGQQGVVVAGAEVGGDPDGAGDDAEGDDDAGQAAQAGVADDDLVEAEHHEYDGAVRGDDGGAGQQATLRQRQFQHGPGGQYGQCACDGGADEVERKHDAAVQVVEPLHAGAEFTGDLAERFLHLRFTIDEDLCGEVHFGYHAGAVSAQKYEGRIPKDELGSSACRGGMQDC